MIITRFAPSPTGFLHLGHAYSALVAHDQARSGGGRNLLRIDDLDSGRVREEYRRGIDEDLAWLGLTPDDAKALALQTFIGAAKMAAGTGTDVATLRANVTSKGGTTQAALESLEADGFRRIMLTALQAADTRGAQLGDRVAARSQGLSAALRQ